MSLNGNRIIGFIPTQQPEEARAFFQETLGLHFVSDDQFAIVFRVGPGEGSMLRVVRTPELAPAPFTIFGWQVDNIRESVSALTKKGVEFLRYGFLQQDELGIWSAPGGTFVAWFHDPDGNTLSLSQHPD